MWRRSTIALVATLALTACGSSRSSSSSSSVHSTSASRSPAACSAAQLRPGYVGTQGATGHLELTLSLHNVSSRPCRVKGYPVATLIAANGKPLPMRVTHGHGFFPDTLRTARPVTLAPGARARFGVSFITNNEYRGARVCRTADRVVAGLPGWNGAALSLRHAPKIAPCGNRVVISAVYT
jgi:uncharacterized protein DUF4232